MSLHVVRLAVAVVIGAAVVGARAPATTPFSFFQPWITVSARDRARVDSGGVVVRTLPADGRQLAIVGLTRLNASPERFVAWTDAIADLKSSRAVLAIQRFSETPVLADLDGLQLDDRDLDALRQCRPDECEVKLARADIESIDRAVRTAGAAWKDAAQRELRRVLLARLRLYQSGGLASLPPYAGDRNPHPPSVPPPCGSSSTCSRRAPVTLREACSLLQILRRSHEAATEVTS